MDAAGRFIKQNSWAWGVLAFLASVVPAVVPLALLGCYYAGDWHQHMWPVGFISNYFRFHLGFPTYINAPELAGIPVPIFYGALMYEVAGFLGAISTPEIGLRLLCALALAFQFVLIHHVTRRLSGSRLWAAAVAFIVTVATYPLTNLYHRAAIPEFFTSVCLTAGIAGWALLLVAKNRKEQVALGVIVAFVLACALGSHPITTLFGVALLCLLAVAGLSGFVGKEREYARPLLKALAGVMLYILLVDGSFFFTLIKSSSNTQIAQSAAIPGALQFYFERSDLWWQRFFPVPFDKASLIEGTHRETAYLELQLNVSLLCLVVGALLQTAKLPARRRVLRPTLIFSALAFGLLTWLSLSAFGWGIVPQKFRLIQCPFRLITYVNAMLLLMLLALMNEKKEWFSASRTGVFGTILLTACMTLAASGFVTKLTHVGATKARAALVDAAPKDPGYQVAPPGSQLFANYVSVEIPPLNRIDAANAVQTRFPLGGLGPGYGEIGDTTVALNRAGWVGTSLCAYTLNGLEVDGKRIQTEALRNLNSGLAVRLSVGRHLIHPIVELDPVRSLLHLIAICFFVLGALVFPWVFMTRLWCR